MIRQIFSQNTCPTDSANLANEHGLATRLVNCTFRKVFRYDTINQVPELEADKSSWATNIEVIFLSGLAQARQQCNHHYRASI